MKLINPSILISPEVLVKVDERLKIMKRVWDDNDEASRSLSLLHKSRSSPSREEFLTSL